MFKLDLDIPTYAEWKVQVEKFWKDQPEQAKKYQVQVEKFWKDQPEQAKKYQEQVQKFWQDWFEDVLKPNLFNIWKK